MAKKCPKIFVRPRDAFDPVEEHQSWVKCNVEHWRPKGHNINSDIIPVLIAEDHSIKHRIMEDISIEQRKSFLNREKGLELLAIYNSLLTT